MPLGPPSTRPPLPRRPSASPLGVRLELELVDAAERASTAYRSVPMTPTTPSTPSTLTMPSTRLLRRLRFAPEDLERRFQRFHAETSLVASRRAVAGTLAVVLVGVQLGMALRMLLAPPEDPDDAPRRPQTQHDRRPWLRLALSLGLSTGAGALLWGTLYRLVNDADDANDDDDEANGTLMAVRGRLQLVLGGLAALILGALATLPALAAPQVQVETNREAAFTERLLFLLLALSAIAILWNVQLRVFGAAATLTAGVIVTTWLDVTAGDDGDGDGIQSHAHGQRAHVTGLFAVAVLMLGRGVFRAEAAARAKFLRLRRLELENLELARHNSTMERQLSSHVEAIGIAHDSNELDHDHHLRSPLSPASVAAAIVGGESAMEAVLQVLDRLRLELAAHDDAPRLTREIDFVVGTLVSEHDLFHRRSTMTPTTPTATGRQTRRWSAFGSGSGGKAAPSRTEGSEWLHLLDEPRQLLLRRRRSQEAAAVGVAPSSTTATTTATTHHPRVVMRPMRRTDSGLRQTVVRQVESYLLTSPRRHATTAATTAAATGQEHHVPPGHLPSADAQTATQLLELAASGAAQDFDVLGFARICRFPLTSVFLTVLEAHNVFLHLPIRLEAAAEFALEVERRYLAKNPYHNAIHGAFVTWDVHVLLRRLQQVELSPLQILGAIVAGAVHDVSHPGVNNAYLVATNAPLAIKYSDDSVLERMHLAEAFQICTLNRAACDVFDGLDRDQRRKCRQLIITMVLATDLGGHLKHVNKLKSKRFAIKSPPLTASSSSSTATAATAAATANAPNAPTHVPVAADDLLFQTIIMMADLGHAAKAFACHLAWSRLVAEEFFRQGDLESQFGLPVSPLCDRHKGPPFDQSQIGFVEFVVLPLYKAARSVLPMAIEDILARVEDNAAVWRQRAAVAAAGAAAAVAQPEQQQQEQPQPQDSHEQIAIAVTDEDDDDDDDDGARRSEQRRPLRARVLSRGSARRPELENLREEEHGDDDEDRELGQAHIVAT